MYKVETETRIQEGASWEDIENGDAYETAYIVYDEEGDIIMDTTNRKLAMRYLDEENDEYISSSDEIIVEWLKQMYQREIEEAQCDISNEHLWELGYDGKEPNPHTENIERLRNYIEILNEKLEELK